MQLTIAVVFLMIGSCVAFFVVGYALSKYKTPVALALAGYAGSSFTWSVFYALQLYAEDPDWKFFWTKCMMFGAFLLPISITIWTMQSNDAEHWLTERFLLAILVVPLFVFWCIWFRERWVMPGYTLYQLGDLSVLRWHDGPVMWIGRIYSYLLVASAMSLSLRTYLPASPLQKKRKRAFLLAMLFPSIGDLLFALGVGPFAALTPTPFLLTASVVIGTWSIFRFRVLDILPIARDTVVQSMRDAVIVVDTQIRILDMNPAAQKLFGSTLDQQLGQPMQSLCPQLGEVPLTDEAERTTESEIALRCVGNQAGRTRWYQLSITPVYSRGERRVGSLFVLRDITERRQIEAELRQAKTDAEEAALAKSNFVASMSHEIRTPLNAVIGMSSLMMEATLTPDLRDYATTIRNSGEILLSVINNVLDFSKIDAGKLELDSHPFDLNACLEDALDLCAPQATAKGLNLAYQIEQSVPTALIGDMTHLRQILVNLIGNAVKFTEQGEVIVTARLQAQVSRLNGAALSTVHFTVRDTGIGIPPDRIPHLFQAFTQVDSSTTRRYGGTGLGLAISQQLCRLMRGEMWVESELEVGSIFHFTIQIETASPPSKKDSQLATWHKKRIVVVDSHATNRQILASQLQRWGIEVMLCPTAQAALRQLQQGEEFDLALLDLQIADPEGVVLIQQIRQHRSAQRLPICLFTALGDRIDPAAMQQLGIMGVLTKPIKQSTLYHLLVTHFVAVEAEAYPSQALASIHPRQTTPAPQPTLQLLVAEDNVVNQKVVLRLLEKLGYRAEIAANGLEVLDALNHRPYDVILMDVQMPEMDGLEATRRIRATIRNGPSPYIIALTASAMQGDRDACLAAGMNAYLSKPVRLEELRGVLAGKG